MVERYSSRSSLLQEAEKIITNDRNKSYGEPDEDFQRIAGIWNALGFRAPGDVPVKGHHVALAMIALKLSRITWSSGHYDSWLDVAGYAGCGYETAQLEEARRKQDGRPTGRMILLGDQAIKLNHFQVSVGEEKYTIQRRTPDGFDPCNTEQCRAGHTFWAACDYRMVLDESR